jgi:hypothetical protein
VFIHTDNDNPDTPRSTSLPGGIGVPLRGVLGNSGASAEKFLENKPLRFMREGGMSIQPVLQVVARISALSDERTCLEE